MKQWSAHKKLYTKYFILFLFLLTLLFLAILAIIIMISEKATLSENTGLFLIFLFVGSAIFLPHHLAVKLVNRERERERLKIISSGNWKFPIDEFYITCVSKKATDVSNNSSVKKMMLIAKHIIENEKIPSEYVHLYYDKEKVMQYFNEKNIPVNSELTSTMISQVNLHYKLKDKLYKEKTKAQLEYLIHKTTTKIKNAKEARSSLHKLSLVISHSAYEKPESDWAVLGGIAQGIAGPAAGIAVASQTIAENAKIAQENQQNKAACARQGDEIRKLADSMGEKLEWELKGYKETLRKLPTLKYFKDIDKFELFKSLKIQGKISKQNDQNIYADICIKNNYASYETESNGIPVAIDGVLMVKLYCDEILVDEFFVALPENGVAWGEETIVKQYPAKHMIGENRKYRFEFSPHNLWLMER